MKTTRLRNIPLAFVTKRKSQMCIKKEKKKQLHYTHFEFILFQRNRNCKLIRKFNFVCKNFWSKKKKRKRIILTIVILVEFVDIKSIMYIYVYTLRSVFFGMGKFSEREIVLWWVVLYGFLGN